MRIHTQKNPTLATKQIRSQKKTSVSEKYSLVTSIDKLDVDATANAESEWFINEDLDLAYFFAFASDSVPSDTSTDVDSDPWSTMNALTSLHTPTKSALLVCEKIGRTHDTLFEVPARRKGQKPILFGRIEIDLVACESSGGDYESSQFSIMDKSHVT